MIRGEEEGVEGGRGRSSDGLNGESGRGEGKGKRRKWK